MILTGDCVSVMAGKKCTGCGLVKCPDDFSKDPHHSDGLKSRCRACGATTARTWRQANPERARQLHKEYCARHPDLVRAQGAAQNRAYRTRFPLMSTLRGMISRCTNPQHEDYRLYGGRGIAVSSAWLGADGYAAFVAAMGPRPTARHSVDRIDNDGNYEAGNVRWATSSEQARNRRPKVFLSTVARVCGEAAAKLVAAAEAA